MRVASFMATMWLTGWALTPAHAQELPRGGAVLPPTVVREVDPEYTPEARKAGIQGVVVMGVVVKADGTVGDVEVIVSLDDKLGLDRQAVAAMKQWRFKPGTKQGKPVEVRVNVEMKFTLK